MLKPFLAGRDIKRYQQPVSDKWLIFTRRGIDISQYPGIYNHLLQYKSRLMPKPVNHEGIWEGRKEGSYQWYEIQDAVDYFMEFEKPKIVIPSIVKGASYSIDLQHFYSNDKTSIIPINDLYLFGLLNSSLVDFYLKSIASTKQNGYFEYKPVYLEKLPILESDEEVVLRLCAMVRRLVDGYSRKDGLIIEGAEKEINQFVYELYKLTNAEIDIVENSLS